MQSVDAKDFILSNDSHKVAIFLAGCIAHKISKKFDCTPCNELLQERSTALYTLIVFLEGV